MCLVVFVASNTPLPVIPFEQAKPAFYARPLSQEEEEVRRLFSKLFVYHVGAASGCGCGFYYQPEDAELSACDIALMPDEVKECVRSDYEQRRESVRCWQEYLAQAVTNDSAEVYACMIGDEKASPDSWNATTPAHFGGDAFRIGEREFLTVRASTA